MNEQECLSLRGVYKIVCKRTNKVYVGGAYVSFHKRKLHHWKTLRRGNHHNLHLQRAWNKYGESGFMFLILEVVSRDESEIEVCEQKWIDTLDCTNTIKGYNICPIAQSRKGTKHSNDSKQNMSEVQKERFKSPEARAKCGNRAGTRWSVERRQRQAELNASPEYKAKMSLTQKGRKRSDDFKSRVSKSMKGRVITTEHRSKISAAHSGKKLTVDHKHKLSIAKKGKPWTLARRLANARK